MSTSYMVDVGYNSAVHRDDAWRALRDATSRLRADTEAIVAEVERLEAGRYSRETLLEYARAYTGDADLTITVHEEESEERGACVRQLASGGGEGREIKEAMRRAFCRLLIEAMHRQRIEVNLIVS